jgi:uncharacterized phiE125 gp8 family phage protein
MRTELVTEPDGPPVTLDQVRDWLAFAETVRDDDQVLEDVINEVTMLIERKTNRKLVTQTWAAGFDEADLEVYDLDGAAGPSWGQSPDLVRVPLYPLVSITGVSSFDSDGTETVLTSTDYDARVGDYPMVHFTSLGTLRRFDAVKVTASVGYGVSGAITDDDILMLVKGLVLHQYQTKGVGYQATVTGQLVSIPQQYRDQLNELRVRPV